MKLTLTNNQNHAVPIMSAEDKGFADELPPSEAYNYDGPNTVLVIGEQAERDRANRTRAQDHRGHGEKANHRVAGQQ